MFKNIEGKLAVAAMLALPLLSHATYTVPTEITDSVSSVGILGAAVFSIMVAIKLFKWLRRAL